MEKSPYAAHFLFCKEKSLLCETGGKYIGKIPVYLVGVAGFEPANDGFRDRCLTTWRYPNE